MALMCLGCGSDLCARSADRRTPSSDVVSTWKCAVQQIHAEYCSDSDISSVLGLLGSGKMCRKCHSAYERYNALHQSLTEKLKKVISERSNITLARHTTETSAKRARIASSLELPARSFQSTSKSSPDVSVSRFVKTTHDKLTFTPFR